MINLVVAANTHLIEVNIYLDISESSGKFTNEIYRDYRVKCNGNIESLTTNYTGCYSTSSSYGSDGCTDRDNNYDLNVKNVIIIPID